MAYYNPMISPARRGAGAFGLVPGDVSFMPMPDPMGDVSKVYPGLTGTIGQASDLVKSKMGGNISPGTLAAITNAQASRGVGQGMPMTSPFNLTSAGLYNTIGKTSEAQAQEGLTDFERLLSGITSNLTVNPSVQASVNAGNVGIAQQNALNAAMPDPQEQASYAEQLYNKYLAGMARSGPIGQPVNPMPGNTFTASGGTMGPSGNAYTNPYTVSTIGGGGTGYYSPSNYSPDVMIAGGPDFGVPQDWNQFPYADQAYNDFVEQYG